MNEAEYQELLEASWRRDLTPAEMARLHAGLAEQPDLRAGWEDESGLNRLLDQLPDAPRSDMRALGYLGTAPIYHKDQRLSAEVRMATGSGKDRTDDAIPLEVVEKPGRVHVVTPRQDLTPGEYGLSFGAGTRTWDFGIDPAPRSDEPTVEVAGEPERIETKPREKRGPRR